MKIPRPSPGRIVLVHTVGMPTGPDVAVVLEVSPDDPLDCLLALVGVSQPVPFRVKYNGRLHRWRYPPREDRVVDVPDEESA